MKPTLWYDMYQVPTYSTTTNLQIALIAIAVFVALIFLGWSRWNSRPNLSTALILPPTELRVDILSMGNANIGIILRVLALFKTYET